MDDYNSNFSMYGGLGILYRTATLLLRIGNSHKDIGGVW